jgi:hypothetical protein
MGRRYPKLNQELDVKQRNPRIHSAQIPFYQVLVPQTLRQNYALFLISISPLLISIVNALPNSQTIWTLHLG